MTKFLESARGKKSRYFLRSCSSNIKVIAMRICIGLTSAAAAWLAFSSNAHADTFKCSFPKGGKTSAAEIVASIEANKGVCALPWRALKAVVQDPKSLEQINSAFDQIAAKFPEKAWSAAARKADVAAAAGHPEDMLRIADENIKNHPEDKSLPNMSCFIRGRYGFDIKNAMPFCDAAVADGRHLWALINRGRVNLTLGNFLAAFQDYNEALGSNEYPTHSGRIDAAYGRGIARLRLGDKGGLRDLQAALRFRPTVAEDFEDGGLVLPDKYGRWPEAAK